MTIKKHKQLIIAHRGLMDGPDKEKENTIQQIEKAIVAGYDVEADLWVSDEGNLYLGHDKPTELLDVYQFKRLYAEVYWHCKNIEAFTTLNRMNVDGGWNFKYFWHDTDSYTLTSNGYIWAYPGMKIPNYDVRVINVLPEWNMTIDQLSKYTGHVCTDYPKLIGKGR